MSFEKDLETIYKELQKSNDNGFLKELFEKELQRTYKNLSAFDIVEIARHPDRPHTQDYISYMFDDFIELHGDRLFGDDPAIVSGFGTLDGKVVGVIGHRKGKSLNENLLFRFGMANPEGYRKALRVAKLLSYKFKAPIISFIDTGGASPTDEAEERGQAEAIAKNLMEFFDLPTPIVAIITGEGGSGGALGIGIADKIFMLKYSIYSVISPEGCASILYGDAQKAKEAAESLKLTADDLFKLGIIDGIIDEPVGGAHRFPEKVLKNVYDAVKVAIDELEQLPTNELLEKRKIKHETMGVYHEG